MFRTLLARYAEFRGVPLFARMLLEKAEPRSDSTPGSGDSLVCWRSGAHTRREDELARDCGQARSL